MFAVSLSEFRCFQSQACALMQSEEEVEHMDSIARSAAHHGIGYNVEVYC